MEEGICKCYINKGLLFKIYKGSVQLNIKKNKQSNLKMGRGHEQTFSQRRNAYGQQTHKKKLSIINHQGNANQNHNERKKRKENHNGKSPHTCQNDC